MSSPLPNPPASAPPIPALYVGHDVAFASFVVAAATAVAMVVISAIYRRRQGERFHLVSPRTVAVLSGVAAIAGALCLILPAGPVAGTH